MSLSMTRAQVLAFRTRAQQLDRGSGRLDDTAVLDLGVQDTGPDGALWALAIRGVEAAAEPGDALVTAWTLRGAPHVYRRRDLPSIAAATAPFSDADAGKRIYNASKPLKAAGIGNVAALDAIADRMRSLVTEPMVKGEVSSHLTEEMDAPFLRHCRPCDSTHLYEMPFRLAALRAGLELEAGTSPPVLRPMAGFAPAEAPSPQHDVVRAYLRLLGPATAKHVADFLDAPVKDVKAHWPDDVVDVEVEGDAGRGEQRWAMADDEPQLTGDPVTATRLLGPFDLFLQARDRALLVDDAERAKRLWPSIGRPGAVLADGEVAGSWRPRKSGRSIAVRVELWAGLQRAIRKAVTEQAERLAAHRGIRLSSVELTG